MDFETFGALAVLLFLLCVFVPNVGIIILIVTVSCCAISIDKSISEDKRLKRMDPDAYRRKKEIEAKKQREKEAEREKEAHVRKIMEEEYRKYRK